MPFIDEAFLQEDNRRLPSQAGLGSRRIEQGQGPYVKVEAIPCWPWMSSREPALPPTHPEPLQDSLSAVTGIFNSSLELDKPGRV